ncbi:hypothetical protein GCM10010129_80800 [Streptomyces fumigatiscleroticus]|nr:hypothetical protein GCM10010129_80800 [Streptomyces fumigatiscleroticus]
MEADRAVAARTDAVARPAEGRPRVPDPPQFLRDIVLGARPRIAQITDRIAGVAMILVGIGLLAERLDPE